MTIYKMTTTLTVAVIAKYAERFFQMKCLGNIKNTNLSYYTNRGPEEGRTEPRAKWVRI
jgi:hypothetical protein